MPIDRPDSNPTPGIRALVAGGTGLVGRELLRLLVVDPQVARVEALVRRAVTPDVLLGPDLAGFASAAKLGTASVDFEQLATRALSQPAAPPAPQAALQAEPPMGLAATLLPAADWAFCALGTTIRQAGSQAAFRRVDFDYPLALARLARQQGARHFLLVSALGADARSRVFYSRVKGELEDAVRALGFESLTLARPSLLEGERSEFRLGEALAQRLGFLTPSRYKPVHVRQVARALVASAHEGRPGVHVLPNPVLRGFAAGPVQPS